MSIRRQAINWANDCRITRPQWVKLFPYCWSAILHRSITSQHNDWYDDISTQTSKRYEQQRYGAISPGRVSSQAGRVKCFDMINVYASACLRILVDRNMIRVMWYMALVGSWGVFAVITPTHQLYRNRRVAGHPAGLEHRLLKPLSHSTAIPRRWHGDLKFLRAPWDRTKILKNIANNLTFSITWRCHGAPTATVAFPRSAHGVPPRSHGVLTGDWLRSHGALTACSWCAKSCHCASTACTQRARRAQCVSTAS